MIENDAKRLAQFITCGLSVPPIDLSGRPFEVHAPSDSRENRGVELVVLYRCEARLGRMTRGGLLRTHVFNAAAHRNGNPVNIAAGA